ncbi:hypothetical protein RO3G_04324 [Rhizopus delemar RA 99-880]|uniref:DUF726-domain-containing protein n=1 Tax=Rhizopus delemar (strain RA 99-880 / ATCC MYA-4621 / FGSC 9543 / NRRL 43880) TaxID=246409 RepID=I1BTT9_RHIO9|nr:hypothetical protein RO3G_04324 [Rhizopus delemar RA 99-880]|eukprot:EIE79619.1 hypothetical protein RO3G_04324 [Rhizopus delemar RA 99-880]
MSQAHSNEETSFTTERISIESNDNDDLIINSAHQQPLTAELLAEQNELNKVLPKPNAIRAWAADLPEVPDSVQPVLTSSHVYEIDATNTMHETKDVFTETQKVAYIGLCYLTSLEVVHDYQGKDFAMARMSADNWQRKLMRMLYVHMDISGEEIKMIESLSKHSILPTDLVHQFTAQGDTAEYRELRCSFRVFVARIASYLSLDWFQVIGFEKRIAEHLLQDAAWETETVNSMATTVTNMTMTNAEGDGSIKSDHERRGRNRQRKKRRYVMVGLATIGGGLILGLSAGLMAPVIAGGIGVILSTVGVTGTAGFLGGTAGIALITGGATVAGGRIGAKGMNRRMKNISTFEFLPVHTEENVNCIVTITGWLPNKNKEETSLPFSTLDNIMGDHYALYWEPEMLEELGSAFKILATEAVTFSIQQALAHTIMGALLAGLSWPLALTKIGYMVDNPWVNALDRSKSAGLVLADVLMNRNLGARPITLVGFSLGARTIFYCLLELARMKAYGLVENVVLFGTPVSASKTQWKECTTVVSGRFVNGYATNDWLLGFLFRTSTVGLGNIAGLRPLSYIEGDRVQNLDCTDLITGHLSYRTSMPKLLKRAGFMVTSEELPMPKEKSGSGTFASFKKSKSNNSIQEECINSSAIDIKNKQVDSIKMANSPSSLSSGKASIQITSKAQSSEPLDFDRTSSSSEAVSTGSTSTLPSSSPSSHEKKELTDYDIIADIIANATAAAAAKSGAYSSLSSGKASIAVDPRSRHSINGLLGSERSRSEPISIPIHDSTSKRQSTSSSSSSLKRSTLLFGSGLFGNKKKIEEDPAKKELKDAGIEIKEIKSTLGRLIVPKDVSDPMPQVKLELPQHARLNR